MQVQRAIYRGALKRIIVAPCVYSAPGKSCLANARLHVGHPYVSVFDIQDCYPSIGPRRVHAALLRHGFDETAASAITRLSTVHHELPQGAPTSSALLNFVFVDLDGKLESISRRAGLTYTRYADDLFLSGGARTGRLARVFKRVLRQHRLTVKVTKRHDWGPHDRHTITGIVVNTKPNASSEYLIALRRTLLEHRDGTHQLTAEEVSTVRGRLAYVSAVNPTAGARLQQLLDESASGRTEPSPC